MAFLITDFRTRFRYRLRDSEATYKYANSVIDAWGNAALTEITALVPHIKASGSIDTDGVNYQFDLSALTRFHLMHRLSLQGVNGHPIPEHPAGIEYIRAFNTGAGIASGDPDYCVVENQDDLYLDAIVAEGTEQVIDSDSRDFTDNTGDWVAGTGSFAVSGGAGVLTTPTTTTLLTLGATYIEDLVVGRRYKLTLDLAYATAWTGGLVTVTIQSNTGTITLTTTLTEVEVDFIANATTATIVITSASIPAAGNQLKIDNVSIKERPLIVEYWQTPRTWIETVTDAVTQSTSPDGLLLTGQDELILGMACVKAGLDIGNQFGDELVAKFYPMVYGDQAKGLVGLLQRFKTLASTTSHKGNSGQMRYAVMGQDPTMEGLLGR